MNKAVYFLAFLSLVSILKAQDPIGSENNPAISAAQVLALNPAAVDGIYWLDPDGFGGDAPFQAYCDMTTDGGAWTLVLLNNASVSLCPTPTWAQVTDSINYNGTLSEDITTFDLFLGVKYWNALGDEMRLDMGASPSSLSHRATYNYSLDALNNYTISMSDEVISINTEGTASPGLYTYHNGRALSTCDADHDISGSNCASNYNCAAWWYGNCWSGSFWAGGGAVYQDAPYWSGSSGEYFDYGAIWVRGTYIPAAPSVTTQEVSDSTYTTAVGHGTVEYFGTSLVTAHGICWDTEEAPEIGDQATDEGMVAAPGAYTTTMMGLTPNATYYVRAYATNADSTGYGNQVSFTTPADVTPPIMASKISEIFLGTDGTATLEASSVDNGTTDDYELDTLYLSRYSYSCEDLGDDTIWLYGVDVFGNIDSIQAIVLVRDNLPPTITCKGNQVVDANTETGYLVAGNEFDPEQSNDNCNYSFLNNYNFSETLEGAEFPLGTTGFLWVVTDLAGNTANCNMQVTVNEVTALATTAEAKLRVYPNPVKDKLTIELPGTKNGYLIELANITGVVVKSITSRETKKEIDLTAYPAGLYLLRITTDGEATLVQVMKQ